jgi:hypothetical protein
MLRALERGLTLRDFEDLTLGMILGYVVTYNNEHLDDNESCRLPMTKEDTVRQATQADFDRF